MARSGEEKFFSFFAILLIISTMMISGSEGVTNAPSCPLSSGNPDVSPAGLTTTCTCTDNSSPSTSYYASSCSIPRSSFFFFNLFNNNFSRKIFSLINCNINNILPLILISSSQLIFNLSLLSLFHPRPKL